MKSAAPSSVKDISEVHTPLSEPSEGCLFPVDTKLKSSEADEGGVVVVVVGVDFVLYPQPSLLLIFLLQRDIVRVKPRRRKQKLAESGQDEL